MQQTSTLNRKTRWFIRFDQTKTPDHLTLYTFIGAKFEAHHILIHSESLGDWIDKTYTYPDIRQVFEEIIFDPYYPKDIFNKILPRLCALRDQLEYEKSHSPYRETAF